jgi:hypothetical protein
MTDATNSPIADALRLIDESVMGSSDAVSTAVAYQLMVHAVALAMQNAVTQQQQVYALRNAVTAAAATAILQSKPQEAEAILALADKQLGDGSITRTLVELQTLMTQVLETFNRISATLRTPAAGA